MIYRSLLVLLDQGPLCAARCQAAMRVCTLVGAASLSDASISLEPPQRGCAACPDFDDALRYFYLAVIYIKGCRAQTPRLKRSSSEFPTRPLQPTSMQPV